MPYFASSNSYKFAEYKRLFGRHSIDLTMFDFDVDEIQTVDVDVIVRDKILKAYARLHRPLIVEHTSLSLDALGGLPEGLTKPFWEKLKDHICEIAYSLGNTRATMKAHLGYCDGIKLWIVHGGVNGTIAPLAAKSGTFHLDRVFIPDGQGYTLSEMSDAERDNRSPRKCAVEELAKLSVI